VAQQEIARFAFYTWIFHYCIY